jgi:FAD/FMN-containing dehydrogenase
MQHSELSGEGETPTRTQRPKDASHRGAELAEALAALGGRLRGTLTTLGDAEFENARRLWNGMIDRQPLAVVRCAGTADVREAVTFARERGLPVSVRGGGHNVSGSAIVEGGLVVDLSGMRSVRVDPTRSVVRVEGGARLGDLDREAQAFGLAVPVGVVSATGVGGLSLHGGMGFLTRRLGLTSDNLVAADVVTGDGRVHVTDEAHEPDLLWALRGGGGIGVVTSLEFRAHPVGPEVWMGIVMYPAADASRVLPEFRAYMAEAPDELMGIAIYWSAPHGEPVAPEHQGAPVIVLAACWSGPMEQGAAAVQPLRELGTPVADLSGPFPYVVAQTLFDADYPNGQRYYWKSIYLNRLDDQVIGVLNDYAARRPSPISSVDVWFLGGAFARVAPEATAFYRRSDPYLLGIEANWTDAADDAANVAWARELFDAARPFSDGGAYFNFPGFLEEGDPQVRRSFGANYERLREVQRRYDPDGLFRHNLGR